MLVGPLQRLSSKNGDRVKELSRPDWPRIVLASLCLQQVRKLEECCNCLGLRWPGLVWTFNFEAWTDHRRSCVADRSAMRLSL